MKAFPDPNNTQSHGMDLRDWFAGLALPVIMPDNRTYPMDAAKVAYEFADAMMRARESNEKNTGR